MAINRLSEHVAEGNHALGGSMIKALSRTRPVSGNQTLQLGMTIQENALHGIAE
ncbi:hypothetical protein D9M68_840050 [compost metagenome]